MEEEQSDSTASTAKSNGSDEIETKFQCRDDSNEIASCSGSDGETEHIQQELASSHQNNESGSLQEDKCLFRLEFKNNVIFDELHTLISRCLRDTLYSLKKSTNVVINRETNSVEILEITNENENDDMIFMIDTLPTENISELEAPDYDSTEANVLLDKNEPETDENAVNNDSVKVNNRNSCWNCDGDHSLRDCKEPLIRNNINRNKQLFLQKNGKNERYHLDADQKYGHLVPGKTTDNLRQALGLRSRELPLYIYKMRLYGYPPGWLENAKVSQSGLSLYNSDVICI